MATVLILVLVGLTSAAAYVAGTRALGRSSRELRVDLYYVIEGVGFAAAFLVLNLVLGVVIVRTLPLLTGWALSVYALENSTLVALSALQGFTFRRWLDRD
jgi:uncharacterized membrane protein YdfJ with MMPL/SSD domain